MQARALFVVQALYKWGFLVCLAVLPMSHTTALRNLLLVVLLALMLAFAVMQRHELPQLLRTARPVPWALLVWCAFLLLFPLWAVYPDEAWANLRGQWGQSMVAWLIGFGAVWLLGRKGPGLWALALTSSFPLALHVLVSLAAWLGMLGTDLPTFLSFGHAGSRFLAHFNVNSWPNVQALPVGFWGVEAMHGNLGYGACQAIALFSVVLLFSWRTQSRLQSLAALLAIALCMVSVLVASSRGAFFYAILVMALAGLVYYWKWVRKGHAQQVQRRQRLAYILIALAVAGLVAAAAYNTISKDQRWQTMADKVRVGFSRPHPGQLICDGLSPQEEGEIRQDFKNRGAAYVDELINGLKDQDGGRILLMRVGLELVMDHPRGLDGSRISYQRLIREECGHEPKLDFAHAHQSWMDLSLALGWLGASLFAWLLLSFARTGWRALGVIDTATWGFAIFLLASFWFLRGFADSLYREHYLQMQALLMAYLFGRIALSVPTTGQDGGRQ